MEYLNVALKTLLDLWLFDINVFKNAWMYYPLLIPVLCYVMFFCVKWVIITLPFWMPIVIIVSVFTGMSLLSVKVNVGEKECQEK